MRDISGRLMSGDRQRQQLQPTELLHECVLRIGDFDSMDWKDRSHFYALATTTMRRVLVDQARLLRAEKRAGQELTLVTEHFKEQTMPIDIQALDEALNRLAIVSRSRARIVELKFFAGMTNREVAEVLDVSEATVKRGWLAARTWLYSEMQE